MNQYRPTQESFIVRGIAVANVGVAAKGLKVIAFDKSAEKEDVVLGETITDSSGNYTIRYKKEALQKMGKQKVDISYLANKTGWENIIKLKNKGDTGHAKA